MMTPDDLTNSAVPGFLDERSFLEKLRAFRPFDDIFMNRLFDNDIPLTEYLLRAIMECASENEELTVIEVTTQRDLYNLTGRSLRLDILARDGDGKLYNAEVQRASDGADPLRARYHSSIMDAAFMRKGTKDFDELPETFVIFITESDVFGRGMQLYRVERMFADSSLPFGDRAHIIYVNGAYRDDSKLGRLMADFACSDPGDMRCELLANKARYLKTTREEIKIMSDITQEIYDMGAKLGEKRGKMAQAFDTAIRMAQHGFSPEKIVDCIPLITLDEAARIHSEVCASA